MREGLFECISFLSLLFEGDGYVWSRYLAHVSFQPTRQYGYQPTSYRRYPLSSAGRSGHINPISSFHRLHSRIGVRRNVYLAGVSAVLAVRGRFCFGAVQKVNSVLVLSMTLLPLDSYV